MWLIFRSNQYDFLKVFLIAHSLNMTSVLTNFVFLSYKYGPRAEGKWNLYNFDVQYHGARCMVQQNNSRCRNYLLFEVVTLDVNVNIVL